MAIKSNFTRHSILTDNISCTLGDTTCKCIGFCHRLSGNYVIFNFAALTLIIGKIMKLLATFLLMHYLKWTVLPIQLEILLLSCIQHLVLATIMQLSKALKFQLQSNSQAEGLMDLICQLPEFSRLFTRHGGVWRKCYTMLPKFMDIKVWWTN